jgi:hypothetical protein
MRQRRVLLVYIEEVHQVQVCKWMTTIEGSLEPLCCLTHSIIQAATHVTTGNARPRFFVGPHRRSVKQQAGFLR